MLTSVIVGIACSILGAVVVIGMQWMFRRRKEKKAPFTGQWYGAYYDDNEQPLVRDVVDLKQESDNLTANISRIFPENQRHRTWRGVGKLKDKNLFAIFWSTTSDIPSYGCVYLRQTSDDCFSGYYLSFREIMKADGSLFGQLVTKKATLERNRDIKCDD